MSKCRDIRISCLESTKTSGTDVRFDGPQAWVADAERSAATGSRKKMLKMKVAPGMCMKTKNYITLCHYANGVFHRGFEGN